MSDRPTSHKGASFVGVDFTGATFRDCDLRHVKVVDSWLGDVSVSGLVERFTVDDVDVTDYVRNELDRRHPERVMVRSMTTADEHRAAWRVVEDLWAATIATVSDLPDGTADERVDDEWSLIETLRHLLFCTDAWAVRTILDRADYHPLGLIHAGYPIDDARTLGLTLHAQPSLDEVLVARADRMATVRGIVDQLDDDALDRSCPAPPAPGYPSPHSVRQCLSVVMREEIEHRRYVVRDLATLTVR